MADGVVTGWSSYATAAADRPYDARPGLLGTTLAAAGRCVTAVGPGAGVGAADEQGRVASYPQAGGPPPTWAAAPSRSSTAGT